MTRIIRVARAGRGDTGGHLNLENRLCERIRFALFLKKNHAAAISSRNEVEGFERFDLWLSEFMPVGWTVTVTAIKLR